jgi:hypothetical protein
VDRQPRKSQKRLQSPACRIIISGREGVGVVPVVVVTLPVTGAVDDEGSAACGCEDGMATLGLGGCEPPAGGFFKGNGLLRFSLAQAFL